MPTTCRPYEPNQILLLSASASDWLPDGHRSHFINEAVEALDLSPFVLRVPAARPASLQAPARASSRIDAVLTGVGAASCGLDPHSRRPGATAKGIDVVPSGLGLPRHAAGAVASPFGAAAGP